MPNEPDKILINANIITLDAQQPKADWLVAGGDDGRIKAIGSDDDRPALGGRVECIDCHGKTVLPGFVDAHIHFKAFAESLTDLYVSPANGIDNITALKTTIRRQAIRLPQGSWIRAKGYHEFDLSEKRHPNRQDLDQAAPDHPVKLTHRSGHAHVLNSLAMQRAGISTETEDPEGGLIDREPSTGIPTGILYEMGDFLAARIPPPQDAVRDEDIKKASDTLLSYGITTIHEASVSNGMDRWKRFCIWKRNGLLRPRFKMMLGVTHFLKKGSHRWSRADLSGWAELQGVKIIVDETTGQIHPSQERLNEWVSQVHMRGGQAIIHAITPPAIESALNAVRQAQQRLYRADHRHRIEHCSVCPRALARQIKALDIRVVTQAGFIYASGDRYRQTVAAHEWPHLYPLKTLMQTGAPVAGGSDAPIGPINPLTAIGAAVTRLSDKGTPVLPEQAIDVMDAIKLYTSHASEATCGEADYGTLSVGKAADLMVLGADPLTARGDTIKDIQVEMTMLGGKTVYQISR